MIYRVTNINTKLIIQKMKGTANDDDCDNNNGIIIRSILYDCASDTNNICIICGGDPREDTETKYTIQTRYNILIDLGKISEYLEDIIIQTIIPYKLSGKKQRKHASLAQIIKQNQNQLIKYGKYITENKRRIPWAL